MSYPDLACSPDQIIDWVKKHMPHLEPWDSVAEWFLHTHGSNELVNGDVPMEAVAQFKTELIALIANQNAIDGSRFRALLSCPRIRIVGSAGFKKDNPDTYRHLGLEFWSHYGTNDITVPMARHMLTELADHMIQINSDTAPAAVTVPVPAVLTSDDLDGLHACMEVKNLTCADVRHVLRVARSGVVDNGMPLNDALAELVGKYGLVKTNLLLGHMADILDHYDAISDSGYVLADAIQDFIDGKVTP